MNTIILAVTPQCLNIAIWEEIHMHLGHQARIPLKKEEKLDSLFHHHHPPFSLSGKQMSCEFSSKNKPCKCMRPSSLKMCSVIGVQKPQISDQRINSFLIHCLGALRHNGSLKACF